MEKEMNLQLEELFPDKVIIGLSSKSPSLYRKVRILAERKRKSVDEYLKSLDYKVQRKNKSNFDTNTVRKLIDLYNVSQTDISIWHGVSKQNISDKLNRQLQGASWVITELEPIDRMIFEEMIKQRKFSSIENKTSYLIKSNFQVGPCFIIVRNKKVSVLFNPTKEIKILLQTTKMDRFEENDFKIADHLEEVQILTKSYARPMNETISFLMRKQAKKNSLTIDEYCILHGFKGYADSKKVTDDEILMKLRKYADESNCVRIPSDAEDYPFFSTHASRNNLSLEDFILSYGYNQLDTRIESNTKKKMECYKSELEKITLDNTNQIFLDINSNLYRNMLNFAKRRDTDVNALIVELGFKRVYRNDVKLDVQQDNLVQELDKKTIILSQLKKIQGSLNKRSTKMERIVRNKELVAKLKELYEHKCQLCSEENHIPLIITEDGTPYVEVHHIVPIGSTNSKLAKFEYEYQELDTYKNAIVVCAHHHKVLHNHSGGYDHLIMQDGQLNFVSKTGDKLKIEVNIHLEEVNSERKLLKQNLVNSYQQQNSEKKII